MANFEEFCNPKSAITVGASSAMVVAFTTTLNQSFGFSQPITALILSGVFALTQIFASKIKEVALYPVYFIIVTLIIFSAARGGTKTVSSIEDMISEPEIQTQASIFDLFIPSSYAQTVTNSTSTNKPPTITTNDIPVEIIKKQQQKKIFNAW